MKKKLTIFLIISMMIFATACGTSKSTEAPTDSKKAPLKAIMIVNGNLGDRAFFDSAKKGVDRLKKDFGVETKVIETGADNAKWQPALADAAEEDVDLIIAITPSMAEFVQKLAPMYPKKKFFLMDAAIDYSKGDCNNVYSATFKQNEGSFLAGALAASVTKSDMPNITPEKLIGFVGGLDVPVINDFLVGYIQGAQYVDPETKVAIAFAGDYYNPAKGKEFGIVLANQNVDVMFAVAGETGLGVIEAAKQKDRYVIGVDTDQSAQFAAEGDTKTANMIVSSMMKNVGDSIYRAVELQLNNKLEFGKNEALGIKEGCVGLAKNEVYKTTVSKDIIEQIEKIEQKVVSGEVKVKTAIGMSNDELNQIRNNAKK